MSRFDEYLRYHRTSETIGDIDPSYSMLRYLVNRFELNEEQRYWLAWLYATTYCGATAFYIYNEFPDFENVNVPRLQQWWDERGREGTIFQTDRRWCRSLNQFVGAFVSYRNWIGESRQHWRLRSIAKGETPEERYDNLLHAARGLYTFGQFTLYLYLEALNVVTSLDLCPTDLDLNEAWSCRDGLLYAYGYDDLVTDEAKPMIPSTAVIVGEAWADLREKVPASVWAIETMLCAYRKWHRGKRHVGYYIDRQAEEIRKMELKVQDGVCWNVLWEYRSETFPHDVLAERGGGLRRNGSITPGWTERGRERTREALR